MTNHENYPNKSDFEPKGHRHGKADGELPLSDPAESIETEVFRENEFKEKGEDKPSAYGENKKRK